MKILKIHIKNLNSLKGEFIIDFTNTPLKNSGLFLISGATGAGKTTILDAITLALYGKAPRFDDSKGKSSTEMMTHGTTESLAELHFETTTGIFMASWKMKRTRTGRLERSARRELAQIFENKPNKILASKITEVNQLVEQLLGGLNFNRFKRSIMLAQGDFAQFLKGTEDRSDILERITDTALYSTISKNAYYRYKKEQEALDKDLQQVGHIELLEEHVLDKLKDEIRLKTKEADRIAQKLEVYQKALAWHQEGKALAQQLETQKGILKKRLEEQEATKTDFQRLAQHLKALPFQADLNFYLTSEQELVKDKATLHELQEKLVSQQTQLDSLRLKLVHTEKEQEDLAQQIQEQKPLWEEVIKIDHSITHINQQYLNTEEEWQKHSIRIEQQKQEDQESKTNLFHIKKELTTVQNWLKTHAQDQRLLDGTIFIHLNDCQSKWKQISTIIQEKTKALQQNQNKLQNLDNQISEVSQQLQICISNQKKLQKKKNKIASFFLVEAAVPDTEILLESLNKEIEIDRLHHEGLVKLVDLQKRRITVLKELDRISEENRAAHIALEKFDSSSLNITDQRNILRQEIDNQHSLCENLKLNMNFEAHRNDLKEGEACPLCMATKHPFREKKNVLLVETQLEQERKKLEQLKSKEHELETRFDELMKDISEAAVSIRHSDQQNQQLSAEWEELQHETKKLYHQFSVLSNTYLDLNSTELRQLLHSTEDAYKQKSEQLKELEQIKHDQLLTTQKINTFKGQTKSLNLQKNECIECITKLEGSIANINITNQELLKDVNLALEWLPQPIQDLKKLAGRIEQLKTRKNTFVEHQKQAQDLLLNKEKIETQLEAAVAILREKIENFNQIGEKKQLEAKQLEELQQRRFRLFEKKDPKEEQQKLEKSLQAINDITKELNRKKNEYTTKFQTSQELLTHRRTHWEEKTAQLNNQKLTLQKKIQKVGFSEMSQLKAAILEEKDAAQIQQQQQHLKRSLDLVQEKLAEIKHCIQTHKEQIVTDLKEIEIIPIMENLAKEADNAQRIIGKNDQILEEQAKKLKKQRGLLQKIDQQKKELERWKNLYDLIGHAEGKKFRQFAQNITLNKLIQLANKHLYRFVAGRYLLKKHAEDSLEIDIIDTFQAHNKRSLSTLSGGETFLASLALALGLSDLASGRSQIASLFIDEGFGTLDSETLAIALKALQSLQAEGKTIGIISHVLQLKNNIDTQIQVNKKSNGFSTIKFVGN